ncbi:RNA polymerase sigma factor [Demequina sp. SO4-18]|uniref:RNA polymerase sigma factor n=1 Tax=Demequina sp. SO4-18 TaxID=3401026 RepID=UPI003B5A23A2
MSGWRATLDDLVRLRGRALFGYAYMLTGDASAAEDLLQDALVKAFRSGRHARSLDAAHVYVKRSIATSFIDSGRRAASRPVTDPRGDAFETWARQHPGSADLTARMDDALDLRAALLTLSPRERACVVLRYLEDMPTADVAETLGIAAGSVKRYVSDGLARLRVAMPEMSFGEPATVAVDGHERGTR